MFTLDSVQTTDNFPLDGSSGGAMLVAQAGSNGGYAAVTGADVYVQLAYTPDGGVSLEWTPQVHVAPGNIILQPGTRGIRFKSFAAGTPATISAGLSENLEPAIQLTSAGVSAPASAGGAMIALADQLLTGAQATFDTNAAALCNGPIPTTAKHLLLVLYARDDTAGTNQGVRLQLNGDAGANYDYTNEQRDGTGAAGGAGAIGDTSYTFGQIAGGGAPAGRVSSLELTLANYLGTVDQKAMNSQWNLFRGVALGDIFTGKTAGLWKNTAAVTRIVVSLAAGNFAAGSRFTLYGYN